MPPKHQSRSIHHAFVTGATGLLGNNLVRSLLKKGIQVTALVRSRQKALEQFGNLPIHFIEGAIKIICKIVIVFFTQLLSFEIV